MPTLARKFLDRELDNELVFVSGQPGHDLVDVDVHVVVHDAVTQTDDGIPRGEVGQLNLYQVRQGACCLSQ